MRVALTCSVVLMLAACTVVNAPSSQMPPQHPRGAISSVSAPLTADEIRALAQQIGACWSVDAGMLALRGMSRAMLRKRERRCPP